MIDLWPLGTAGLTPSASGGPGGVPTVSSHRKENLSPLGIRRAEAIDRGVRHGARRMRRLAAWRRTVDDDDDETALLLLLTAFVLWIAALAVRRMNAAPGQRLREFQVGVYAAKLFERGLPGLFVSGRYGLGFVERVVDISHNRSLADLEVGYFFSSRFRAFTMTNAGYTHGGIDSPQNGLPGLPVEYRLNHDQIQKVHHLTVGAGAAYPITDSFDVFGSFSRLVTGRNGHALNRGVTIGAS